MPRLFHGNFDFEHQLTGAAAPSPHSKLGRINAELTPGLVALADHDDCLLCPAPFHQAQLNCLVDAGLPRPRLLSAGSPVPAGFMFVPWGWSAAAAKLASQVGASGDHPPLEVVKQVNCRRFAHELETRWNCGLAGAASIGNLDELATAVRQSADFSPGWVLKARFGMSGRERHLGSGVKLDSQVANWVKKRLARDGAVLLEPWVQRIDEAGLQFEIPRDGEPQLLGITPQLCDESGHYQGNRITISDAATTDWQPAVGIAQRLAAQLQRIGYFGPLGIDAMRYRDARGNVRIRPLQDINARYTMGRLALGFRRCLAAHEAGAWLHFSCKPDDGSRLPFSVKVRNHLPAGSRVIPTSPALIDRQPPRIVHLILAAPSEGDLAAGERLLLDAIKNPAG